MIDFQTIKKGQRTDDNAKTLPGPSIVFHPNSGWVRAKNGLPQEGAVLLEAFREMM